MVADPEVTALSHFKDFIRHLPGIFAIAFAGARQNRADPDRSKHGCNPGARQFTVMGQDGRTVRPVDRMAWYEVSLKVVSVQLDQTGRHKVTLHVPRPPLGATVPLSIARIRPSLMQIVP